VKKGFLRRLAGERGQAMLETAMTLPLVLVVCVGIFEFGRAYQTWQILTNAAREGARLAVLPGSTVTNVQDRVRQYLTSGEVSNPSSANVAVTTGSVPMGSATVPSSIVTVSYPYSFIVLQPVVRLLVSTSNVGSAITMVGRAEMRNEM
jgi:Flp pilus assembly protein TadG